VSDHDTLPPASADQLQKLLRTRDPSLSEDEQRRRDLGVRMALLARQLRARFDQRVESRGLTRTKWMAIAAVASNSGLTQRTLATIMEITEVSAGRLIDRLCLDGYLRREQHPQDRRAYRIYVTDAAKPIMDELREVSLSCEEEAYRGLSKDDIRTLETLLQTIYDNLADAKSRAVAEALNVGKT